MFQFDPSSIKTIGVFTSGGDAPGMNAAIRAVVRYSLSKDLRIKGIIQGYRGMVQGQFMDLEAGTMANIIQRGGTVLKTGRLADFHKEEVRSIAATKLREAQIDALVCIGGDGSFKGDHLLGKEHQIPIVGVPGTIDNDIFGTDLTIGFDTAVNVALDAIDRIRDTAASHDRLFIVEVMGRDSGFIATHVGLAGGAEEIFFPGNSATVDSAIEHIKRGIARGKSSSILVTAEGQKPGRAYDLAEAIRKKAGFDAKVCVLGHIQRGGSPTASDRILASRLGAYAVSQLLKGHADIMVGLQKNELATVDLAEVFQKSKPVDLQLITLSQVLAI